MKKASGEVTLHLHTKKIDHMMYASWDKDCNRQWHFGPFFAFYHTNNPERQNFEKKKNRKAPGDIILLKIRTINRDHMMYGFWNIRCNRHEFFVILGHFLHFYLLTIWKSKLWNMKKIPGGIIILQMCTINDDHTMYGSWDMVHDRWTAIQMDRWTDWWMNGNQ